MRAAGVTLYDDISRGFAGAAGTPRRRRVPPVVSQLLSTCKLSPPPLSLITTGSCAINDQPSTRLTLETLSTPSMTSVDNENINSL